MNKVRLIIYIGFSLIMVSMIGSQTREHKQNLEAKVIKTIKLSNLIPTDLIFSSDGNLLFCGALSGSFNPNTGKMRISMDRKNFIMDIKRYKNIANLNEMSILCFSNRNEVFIKNNGIKKWDYKSRKDKGSITNIDGSVYCTLDGKYAVTIVDDKKAIMTDLEVKNQIGDYQIPLIDATQRKYLFDGPDKLFMLCLQDTILKYFDIIQNKEIASFSLNVDLIEHVTISSDNNYLAVSSGGPIYLIDINNKSILTKIEMIVGRLNSLTFSRNCKVLGGCTSGNQVVLLDMKSKSEMFFNLGEHKGPIKSICFSPTEDIFVTSSFDGTIKIWEYYFTEDI